MGTHLLFKYIKVQPFCVRASVACTQLRVCIYIAWMCAQQLCADGSVYYLLQLTVSHTFFLRPHCWTNGNGTWWNGRRRASQCCDPVPFLPDPDPGSTYICLFNFEPTKCYATFITRLERLVTLKIKEKIIWLKLYLRPGP